MSSQLQISTQLCNRIVQNVNSSPWDLLCSQVRWFPTTNEFFAYFAIVMQRIVISTGLGSSFDFEEYLLWEKRMVLRDRGNPKMITTSLAFAVLNMKSETTVATRWLFVKLTKYFVFFKINEIEIISAKRWWSEGNRAIPNTFGTRKTILRDVVTYNIVVVRCLANFKRNRQTKWSATVLLMAKSVRWGV